MANETNNYFADLAAAQARAGVEEAFASPETPEQAAERIQRARAYGLGPGQVDAVSPQEEAARLAQEQDWAYMQANAPVLTEMLSQRALANLYKDDLTNASVIERMIHMLSPDEGDNEGVLGSLWSAFSRGGYQALNTTPIFGTVPELRTLNEEAASLDRTWAAIQAGEDVSEQFATAEDPTGQVGLAAFKVDYPRQRRILDERIREGSVEASRAAQFSALYPANENVQRFMEAKDLPEALSLLKENPGQIIASVGMESLVANAPVFAALAATGGAGIGPQMVAAFTGSYGADYEAEAASNLAEAGVDWTNPDSIYAAFSDPSKAPMIAKAADDARAHATGTAIFDALSVGLASRSLFPKSIARTMEKNVYAREFANMAAQMPVQGAMGGAGEALGQYLSDGEISSWADVVAEVVGESFSAPVEVLTTGMQARIQAGRDLQKAQARADAVSALSDALGVSKVGQLDPETQDEHIRRMAEAAKTRTVEIDAQAFQQAGLAEPFADVPEVAEQLQNALASGGDITLPLSTYAKMLGRMGTGEAAADLISITAFHQKPSVAEAQAQTREVEERNKEEAKRLAAERRAIHDSFRKEVSQIGKRVGKQLRALGITREEAAGIQALVQAFVGAMARDTGMQPSKLWDTWGWSIEEAPADGGEYGSFVPEAGRILRNRNANRSTLLHETAHAFLNMRASLAANMAEEVNKAYSQAMEGAKADPKKGPSAQLQSQKRFVDDTNALIEWLGGKDLATWKNMPVEEQRAAHEKFARSFEGYFMAGRPPAAGLRSVFVNFSRWLRSVYGVAEALPGSDYGPDVKRLFDSMFLAAEQVRTMAVRQNAQLLFNSAEEAGMSPVEWEEYNEYRRQVTEDAIADMTSRNAELAAKVDARREQLIAGERRKLVDEQVAQENEKLLNAWNKIAKGAKDENGKDVYFKIHVDDLRAMGLSDEQVAALKEGRIATEQKWRCSVGVEALAAELGYANGRELVDALLPHPNVPAYLKQVADERIATEAMTVDMRRELELRVNETLFNEARLRILRKELDALERMGGGINNRESTAFEDLAFNVVAGFLLEDLPRAGQYVQAATRAARRSRKAYRAGKIKEAIFYKRQEVYMTAMVKAIKDARDGIQRDVKLIRRFKAKEVKGVDTRLVVVIQRALAAFGFYTNEQLSLNPGSIVDELNELQAALQFDFDVDDRLIRALAEGKRDYLRTVDDWRNFMDFIKQMEALGRREQTVRLEAEARALAEIQDQGSATIAASAAARGRNPERRQELLSKKANDRNLLRKFGYNHARAAALFAALDGKVNGLLTRLMIYSSDECATREARLKTEFVKKVDAVLRPIEKTFGDDPKKMKTSKVFGVPFSTSQAFTALLNYGNDGNRQRLIATMKALTGHEVFDDLKSRDPGTRENAQEKVDAMMAAFFGEYLTDAHFEAAEKIWAIFEEMRQKTDVVAKRVTGRSPVWVEPRQVVVLVDGQPRTLSGGYYPIVYDRELNIDVADLKEVKTLNDMKGVFSKSGTMDGHLKSRVRHVQRGVTLVPRGLFSGLDDQIHYVAWAEWSNETRKILNPSGAIAQTIHAYYGREFYEALKQWWETCRDGTADQNVVGGEIANALRSNVSLAGVGFNLSTAFLQVVGITQTVAYLGGEWAGRGIADFLRMGPKGSAEWVRAKSAMMRDRMQTQFREMAEIQARLVGTNPGWKDKLMRAAYLPLSYMQYLVDLPTWIGAYQKALANGAAERLAIAEADRAVINAQGSGRVTDLSAIERGNPYAKLLTVFYTFFNTALNLAYITGNTQKGMQRAVNLLMILVLQPVIESFLRAALESLAGDGGQGDDEEWAMNMMKNAAASTIQFNLGLFVGVRELGAMVDDYGYSGPAGFRKVNDFIRAFKSGEKALETGEISEATIRHMATALSLWKGLPAVPITRAISGGNALLQNKTDNYFTLITGYKE